MMRPDVTVTVCHIRSVVGWSISLSETRDWLSMKSGGAARGSADLVNPAERVGLVAVLEANQLLAQAHGHRAGLAVRDQPLRVLALDPADRGDDRPGAAGGHPRQLSGLH